MSRVECVILNAPPTPSTLSTGFFPSAELFLNVTFVPFTKLNMADSKHTAPPTIPELFKKVISVDFPTLTVELTAYRATPLPSSSEFPTNFKVDFTVFSVELYSIIALRLLMKATCASSMYKVDVLR